MTSVTVSLLIIPVDRVVPPAAPALLTLARRRLQARTGSTRRNFAGRPDFFSTTGNGPARSIAAAP